MSTPLQRPYRLVLRGEAGLSCDNNGLALGAVDLVRPEWRGDGAGGCEVRSPEDIAQILEAAYGAQRDEVVLRLHQGLCRAAAWIEAGDIGRASVEAVKLSLPELTSEAMAKLAAIADLEERSTAWQTEPRVPAGQPGGGQWTTDGGASMTATRPLGAARDRRAQGERLPNPPFSCDVSSPVADTPAFSNVASSDAADGARLIPVSTAAAALGGAGADGSMILPKGVARLGRAGLLAYGAALLDNLSAASAQEQVTNAIARFGLDASRPADVMAASAYVWSRYKLPFLMDAPFSGAELDAASRAVMRLVLVEPGAFVATLQGANSARDLIVQAAKGGLADYAVESRARPAGVEPALQTTSRSARKAIEAELQAGYLWAHHLVPAGVWKRNIDIARLAAKDGWRPDNPSNLIGLPADDRTYEALDGVLPIHNDFHPKYDADTRALIAAGRASLSPAMTSIQAHGLLDDVAMINRIRLFARQYHKIVKVGV